MRFRVNYMGLLTAASVAVALPDGKAEAQILPLPANHRVAVGDFDGDHKDDVAVGVPYADVGNAFSAGKVRVFYGKNYRELDNSWFWSGAPSAETWSQSSPGVNGAAEKDDYFGIAVAAGDFNGDGAADLAIGVSGEDTENNAVKDSGVVHVIYGKVGTGLQTSSPAPQLWDQGTDDGTGAILGSREASDACGFALAAGNFNGDKRTLNNVSRPVSDLAFGCPTEDLSNGITNGGAVNIVYGSSSGLRAVNNQLLTGKSDNDLFGLVLHTADTFKSGHSDLYVGMPWRNVSGGDLYRHMGYSSGVDQTGQRLELNLPAGSRYGTSIAVNPDANYPQVFVGAPGMDSAKGKVFEFVWDYNFNAFRQYASFTQDSGGAGLPEADDFFGWALALGTFRPAHGLDLAVSAAYEDIGSTYDDQGWVGIYSGDGNNGLLEGDAEEVNYSSTDASREYANLGVSMAGGDFDNDGDDDLVMITAEGLIRTY
jgi:hypothetical protein